MTHPVIKYLDDIKKVREAATKGYWSKTTYGKQRDFSGNCYTISSERGGVITELEWELMGREQQNANATFIAQSSVSVPVMEESLRLAFEALSMYELDCEKDIDLQGTACSQMRPDSRSSWCERCVAHDALERIAKLFGVQI